MKNRLKALQTPGTMFVELETGILREVAMRGEHPWVYVPLLDHAPASINGLPAETYDHDGVAILRVLRLTLTRVWFLAIQSGEKREEYRELKQHWHSRFVERKTTNHRDPVYRESYQRVTTGLRQYDLVHFRNGYQTNAPELMVHCEGVRIGQPRAGWAPKSALGIDHYVVALGGQCRVGEQVPADLLASLKGGAL